MPNPIDVWVVGTRGTAPEAVHRAYRPVHPGAGCGGRTNPPQCSGACTCNVNCGTGCTSNCANNTVCTGSCGSGCDTSCAAKSTARQGARC